MQVPSDSTIALLALLALSAGCGREDAVRAATAAAAPATAAHTAAHPVAFLDHPAGAQVRRVAAEYRGDLGGIRQRGVLRVLVSLDRTGFFVADGQLRGFEFEMFRELEKHLASQRAADELPLEFVYVPLPFDELLDALLQGQGDVAAAELTVTPDRLSRVAFSEPYRRGVRQVLVAHESAPRPNDWADLAGRRLVTVAGTSHAELAAARSRELAARGLDPIRTVEAPPGVSSEDLLDLVAEGTLAYALADDFVAQLWAQAHPALVVVPEVASEQGLDLAWAVRPDNPQLRALLDEWAQENRKGTLLGNILSKRYFASANWLRHPLADIEHGRLAPLLPALKRYSKEYGFDWRLMAAQAYQESRLDPDAVSDAGAVGLMQLLPATAADMGFTDLRDPDTNLHAGIRYMAWIRDQIFSKKGPAPAAAADLTLAAYNAGPARVKRWREEAPARGLDPDRWFGQVEQLALDDVGLQPVSYVAHVNAYAIVLGLLLEDLEARSRGMAELRAAARR